MIYMEWKLLSNEIPKTETDCLCLTVEGNFSILTLDGEVGENGGSYFWVERGEWELPFGAVLQWTYLPNPKEILL